LVVLSVVVRVVVELVVPIADLEHRVDS